MLLRRTEVKNNSFLHHFTTPFLSHLPIIRLGNRDTGILQINGYLRMVNPPLTPPKRGKAIYYDQVVS